jgi:hypothetical protein
MIYFYSLHYTRPVSVSTIFIFFSMADVQDLDLEDLWCRPSSRGERCADWQREKREELMS